ncbi:Transcriptional regulator, LysR family protein [Sandaracinus amylolyticus]|uniref:Transcriptional regulator, LysR family protein n=1 Tax=Sandaracinus amylolyticus TaxID=927083 RepID=A0A0F6YMY1_9BACT|nr:Transcriptional regulator, LysR family protein [Sandaracinus amylolyticus]
MTRVDRLEAMRAFVAVAEERGFASAARRLAMSPPAVTRAIASLEERIGTRLLHRTTRVVRLTDAGERYLADCKRILRDLEDAETIAAGLHAEPRGRLAVTAPATFGRLHVAPIVLELLERHPLLSVRALFVDHVVDLAEEGVDVAVRIAHLPDSSMRAVRVGTVRRVVCASPAYLEAHGAPRSPAELADRELIAFSGSGALRDWTFESQGETQVITPHARLIVNGAELAIAAALAGRGLTRVLSYQVEPELRAGRLRVVLEDHEPPPIPVHVVHREGRAVAAKVRAFVDLATTRLRAVLGAD